MRFLLLLNICLLSALSLMAASEPLAEFRRSLSEEYADVPADDPTRLAVVQLVERIAADPGEAAEWQLHHLRSSLDIARILRTLTTAEVDPAGQALVTVLQRAGTAADEANRALVESQLGEPAVMVEASLDTYSSATSRWYRLTPLADLIAERAAWQEEMDHILPELPDDQRAAVVQRRSAVVDRLREAALAVQTAMQAQDVIAEITAIGAVRAAWVDHELLRHDLDVEAVLLARPADAPPAGDLRERIRASMAAYAATRHALVAAETTELLLQYQLEGLWDREARWLDTIDKLRSAWVEGETALAVDQEIIPTPADRDVDRAP